MTAAEDEDARAHAAEGYAGCGERGTGTGTETRAAGAEVYNGGMSAPASVLQELHELIETLDSKQAIRVLAMIGLMTDDGELTAEEEESILRAMAEMEAGEFVTQEEIEREFAITSDLLISR